MYNARTMPDRKPILGRGFYFDGALYKLPPDNHPLLRTDESIMRLNALRAMLESAVKLPHKKWPPLNRRLLPLERDAIDLMEKWSFRRRLWEAVEIRSATISYNDRGSPWAGVYDECYRWKICRLDPIPPDRSVMLVCIETNRSELEDESMFDIGLVKYEEVMELLKLLGSDSRL